MLREKSLKNKILKYVYITSQQPILLRDMLVVNKQFNNGLQVDSGTLGFRLLLSRAYFVYTMLVLFILIPISLLMHEALAKIDPHISIVGGMILTGIIFAGFNFFRDKMQDMMTQEAIKKSWRLHFPFFSYEEYSKKVDLIFEQSIKEEVSKRDLEKYILDKLSS